MRVEGEISRCIFFHSDLDFIFWLTKLVLFSAFFSKKEFLYICFRTQNKSLRMETHHLKFCTLLGNSIKLADHAVQRVLKDFHGLCMRGSFQKEPYSFTSGRAIERNRFE